VTENMSVHAESRTIQETILPHAEQWAKRSGAIFEADKTSLIHFTKRAQPDNTRAVYFGGTAIMPQSSVKVLRVTLDKKLAMDEHISRVTTKGIQACLSLQAIEGTRPAQMRQLFHSCVLRITDYVASVWYGPGKTGVVRLAHSIDKVQRLGARTILRAWKRVALPVLEAEACLVPTRKRLEKRVLVHATELISLSHNNLARKAMPAALNVNRHVSPLNATIAACKKRLRPSASRPPLGNPAWIQAPQVDHSHRVTIEEKDNAIRDISRAAAANVFSLYTDASVTKRLTSIAVVHRTRTRTQVIQQDSISWATTCGVLSAEIAAIVVALKYAKDRRVQQRFQQLAVFSNS